MTATNVNPARSGADRHPARTVTVVINGQDVELDERVLTGQQIKAAAIAQGVTIEPNFVLSMKHGNRYEVVGDDDALRVHPHQEFLAVAPDDNS